MLPLVGGAPAGASTSKGELGFDPAENTLKRYVKLIGSLANEDVYIALDGTLWGVLPGHLPLPICGFHGLARANWEPQSDGAFSQRSFDIGFFADPETGTPLESLVNPFTMETVKPFHYKYGGEETIHTAETAPKPTDSSWTMTADKLWFSERRSGAFPAPFPPTEWPRETAGETYYYGSETSYVVSAKDIIDDNVMSADYSLFWTAFLSWEPWLLMAGAPGYVMWRGVASKVAIRDQISDGVLAYIAEHEPNYFGTGRPWKGRASTYESYKKRQMMDRE